MRQNQAQRGDGESDCFRSCDGEGNEMTSANKKPPVSYTLRQLVRQPDGTFHTREATKINGREYAVNWYDEDGNEVGE